MSLFPLLGPRLLRLHARQTFNGPTTPDCEFDSDGECPWGCDHGWTGCPDGMTSQNGETCEPNAAGGR